MSAPALPEDDYAVLTTAEVAEWLRVSHTHVGELVRRGVLHPLQNMGRCLRFSRRSVLEFIQSNGRAS